MNENTDRSTQQKGIQLTRALKSRHIFMLSLGGVIGTGLFMGSGVTINQGGPVGAILAYLVAGFLMYLVMVTPEPMNSPVPMTPPKDSMKMCRLLRARVSCMPF